MNTPARFEMGGAAILRGAVLARDGSPEPATHQVVIALNRRQGGRPEDPAIDLTAEPTNRIVPGTMRPGVASS
jgi:hypothetical protein